MRKIDLSHAAYISPRGLSSLFRSTNLHAVELKACSGVSDESIAMLCASSRSLARLGIAYCSSVTDKSLYLVADAFPDSLVYFDIAGCLRVTDEGVRYAISHAKALRKLRIGEQYGRVSRSLLDADVNVRFVRALHEVGREPT